MKWYFLPLVLVVTFIVFTIIQCLSKSKRPLNRAFLSLISGIAALISVDLLSGFTGVYIPISVLSLLISVALGIPGITSMLLINLIF